MSKHENKCLITLKFNKTDPMSSNELLLSFHFVDDHRSQPILDQFN